MRCAPSSSSRSEIERPLTSASAPPLMRDSRPISSSSSISTRTADGVSAISSSVPSTSRKKSALDTGAGGRRRDPFLIRLSASLADQPAAPAHGGGVEQHAAGPAEDIELGHQSAHQAHAVALLGPRAWSAPHAGRPRIDPHRKD
jgi:hypothetical protein